MQGTIGFENLQIECIIGELPEEREHAQSIFVSLKVDYDFSACALSDDLKDTVDYVVLANDCINEAVKGEYAMLETYVSRLIDRLLNAYPVTQVWIRVCKPKGLPHADYSFVELSKRNA